MKKRTGVLLIAGLLSLSLAVQASASEKAQLRGDITIVLNQKEVEFRTADNRPAYPILYQDSTYLPLRAIGELMGKNVNWDEATKTITIGGTRTTSTMGQENPAYGVSSIEVEERPDFSIYLDGQKLSFTSASGQTIYPLLYEGSTYLPLRAIGELMGSEVDWNASTKTVTLQTASQTVTDADSFTAADTSERQEGYIGRARARQIALAQAGVSEADAGFLHTEMDYENGRWVYEVEFYTANREYDYTIDATTGDVVGYDFETEYGHRPQTGTAEVALSEQEAKQAALDDAGVSASEATFVRSRLDYDDGRRVYEVEFYTANREYDYEIDAATGEILSVDWDAEGYLPSAQTGSGTVTAAQAEQTALDHAGLSRSEVDYVRTKQDYDDGRRKYEVEFRQGRMEYEYEIDAATGRILDFSRDFDD